MRAAANPVGRCVRLFTLRELAAIAILLAASGARAAAPDLTLSAGDIAIHDKTDPRRRYGVELRFAALGRWLLRPTLGAINAENDARYAYLGLRRDFRWTPEWTLTPSADIGAFDGGDEIRLGSLAEFRTGIELSWGQTQQLRVGIALYHLSNGGTSRHNPGTEELALTLTLPLSW